jgi:hypothetical protein
MADQVRRSRVLLAALATLAVLCVPGCTITTGPPSAAPPVVATVDAFETFSGMVLPAAAEHLDLRASTDEYGEPSYSVDFDLPTAEIDRFSSAGRLGRTLRITTVPASVAATFSRSGDTARGMRWAEGLLPSNMRIQRELFAVGSFTDTAHVQVHAYRMGR